MWLIFPNHEVEPNGHAGVDSVTMGGVEWTRTASASAHFTEPTQTHLGQALDHRNLTRALEEVEAELGDDVHLCVKITYGYDC